MWNDCFLFYRLCAKILLLVRAQVSLKIRDLGANWFTILGGGLYHRRIPGFSGSMREIIEVVCLSPPSKHVD